MLTLAEEPMSYSLPFPSLFNNWLESLEMVEYIMCLEIPANCPYLIGTVPILTLEKGAVLPYVPSFAKICLL